MFSWIWQRFLHDFWPPDSSSVGPNLVASLCLVIPAWAFAEVRIVRKITRSHESVHARISDLEQIVKTTAKAAEDVVDETATQSPDKPKL